MMPRRCFAAMLTVLLIAGAVAAQDRKTKVLRDKEQLADDGTWIYNDLDRAIGEAKRTAKPLLVVLRCIPCEACSEFDKRLLEHENEARDLLDRFVCVRIVQANGLDLSLFQFDYDQSFHILFLNADRTIYGRYGTRSARREEEDMTHAGLRQAMLAVLDLHKNYPANKAELAGKQGRPMGNVVPEELPGLKGKYGSKLDYEGKVMASCIHCHQIRDSERLAYRQANKPMPADVLFPYPLPDVLGLAVNPNEPVKVTRVEEDSIAAKSGLRTDDRIVSLAGQPLVSTADLQWVLHRGPAEGELAAKVMRGADPVDVRLSLPHDWRSKSDISWRATSWELRRIGTGGLLLEDLSDKDRRSRGLPSDRLALRVKHVGEYGEHAAAKRAGFKKEDVIVAVGDESKRLTEGQLFRIALSHRPGAVLPVKVVRGDQTVDLKLPIQ